MLCCATPEGLLQHAKHVATCQSRAREASARPACKGSGGPLPTEVDIFSARPQIASVVRSAAACAVALPHKATTAAGKIIAARQGVSSATVGWLRARFGADVRTCERALLSMQ